MSLKNIFVCPYCGKTELITIEDKEIVMKGVWRLHALCGNCHMMWSVKVIPTDEEE